MSITRRGAVLAAMVSAAVAVTAGTGHAGSRPAAHKRDHQISTTVDSSMMNNAGQGHCVQYSRHTVIRGEETSEQDGRCEWQDAPEPTAARPGPGESRPAGAQTGSGEPGSAGAQTR